MKVNRWDYDHREIPFNLEVWEGRVSVTLSHLFLRSMYTWARKWDKDFPSSGCSILQSVTYFTSLWSAVLCFHHSEKRGGGRGNKNGLGLGIISLAEREKQEKGTSYVCLSVWIYVCICDCQPSCVCLYLTTRNEHNNQTKALIMLHLAGTNCAAFGWNKLKELERSKNAVVNCCDNTGIFVMQLKWIKYI